MITIDREGQFYMSDISFVHVLHTISIPFSLATIKPEKNKTVDHNRIIKSSNESRRHFSLLNSCRHS